MVVMMDDEAAFYLGILRERLYEHTEFATKHERLALLHAIYLLEERIRQNTRSENEKTDRNRNSRAYCRRNPHCNDR